MTKNRGGGGTGGEGPGQRDPVRGDERWKGVMCSPIQVVESHSGGKIRTIDTSAEIFQRQWGRGE